MDEHLSSSEAKNQLKWHYAHKNADRGAVDKKSAELILQTMSAKLIQLIFCIPHPYQHSYERGAILVGFWLLKRIKTHQQKQRLC